MDEICEIIFWVTSIPISIGVGIIVYKLLNEIARKLGID